MYCSTVTTTDSNVFVVHCKLLGWERTGSFSTLRCGYASFTAAMTLSKHFYLVALGGEMDPIAEELLAPSLEVRAGGEELG